MNASPDEGTGNRTDLTRQISNARTTLSTRSCGVRPVVNISSRSRNHGSSLLWPYACVHARAMCVCACARACARARACVRRVCADLQVLDGPVDVCFDALGDEHALVHDPDLHMTMFIEAHEKNCQAHEKLFQKRCTAWGNVSPLRVATSRSSRHRTLRGISFFESGKTLLVKAPPKISALKSATTRFVTIFSQAMTILVYSLRRLFKL